MADFGGERAWVRTLVPRLQAALANVGGGSVEVSDGQKLPYTSEIHAYSDEGTTDARSSSYETDLLIIDRNGGGWIPRVVVECKLGAVTTHDALSYSTKAATHKHVHPYLRYGFLAGALPSLPARLIKHGVSFDFMATWPASEPADPHWSAFVSVIADEILASRKLQALFQNSRFASQQQIHLLRKPLVINESGGSR